MNMPCSAIRQTGDVLSHTGSCASEADRSTRLARALWLLDRLLGTGRSIRPVSHQVLSTWFPARPDQAGFSSPNQNPVLAAWWLDPL